jgi:uncharacterized protein (DUF2141 family)
VTSRRRFIMKRVLSLAWVVVVVIALLRGAAVGGDGAGSVVVTIEGFREYKGPARVALFSHERGFPDDESGAYRKIVSDIQNGQVQVRFDELPEGSYALLTYHDENGDEKFNIGLSAFRWRDTACRTTSHATRVPVR